MLKKSVLLALGLMCSSVTADEIDDLRDMAKLSEEYRDISIECFVEMKMQKADGWASDSCDEYKNFAKNGLPIYKTKISKASSKFVSYSQSEGVSIRKVKRGLKHLFIIQSNIDAIDTTNKKIRAISGS